MNSYLEKVKEFMITFGQPVLDKPTLLPEDRQKLRIALIFEELKEYAEASGKSDYLIELCHKCEVEFTNDSKNDKGYIPIINQVEQLDALLDLQYVLSGAVHEHGFGEIFDKAFEEVHNSNMSKACSTEQEAIDTIKSYTKQNIQTFYRKEENYWIVYRVEDLKVLKSHKYKPAQLAQFLNK